MKGSDPSREDMNTDAALEEAAVLCTSAREDDASFHSMMFPSKGGYRQS